MSEVIAVEFLAQLLPMHAMVDDEGDFVTCGPTLRKVIGPERRFDAAFEVIGAGEQPPEAFILDKARTGERILLRVKSRRGTTLRGHAVSMGRQGLLLNLSFGIGIIEAIRDYQLTDADFTPTDQVMELLFLHEANRAITAELSRFNMRLFEARETAEAQAFTDPLTGLYNRRGLELALNVALTAHGGQRPDDGFGLLHLDLDRFKEVNDRLGHAAGDQMLQHVAEALRSETRQDDNLARIGGDEFVILLAGRQVAERMVALGNRIIARIEQPLVIDGVECSVSASIGATMTDFYPDSELGQMQADADAALYRAKRAGRGCVRLHEPSRAALSWQGTG